MIDRKRNRLLREIAEQYRRNALGTRCADNSDNGEVVAVDMEDRARAIESALEELEPKGFTRLFDEIGRVR